MHNLSSYCGLVDVKIRASDKDLPVLTQSKTNNEKNLAYFLSIHFIRSEPIYVTSTITYITTNRGNYAKSNILTCFLRPKSWISMHNPIQTLNQSQGRK